MKIPLEFQHPKALWLLAALVPLVVLYVLRERRARVVVPSTWLWASAQRDIMARSPFKRLVPQVPLFLQAAALTLLSLALAGPSTRHRAILGQNVAIIIDVSASMGAVDPTSKQQRIELARLAALDALGALAPGASAMLVEAGREPRVVAPLDPDIKRLQAAVDRVTTLEVEGDLGSAVALAVDRLAPLGGDRRVLVFTDGCLARADGLVSRSVPLELFTVGQAVDNAAIVRLDVRAGHDSAANADETQAFALVANASDRPRDVFVSLRLDSTDAPLASRRVLLPPGERTPVLLSFRPSPADHGRGLVIELSPHDALAADDVAFARVPPPSKQPVVLLGPKPSPWLERAFASDPQVELSKGPVDAWLTGKKDPGALAVFDGVCPPSLPPGDFVVVGPPPGPCMGVVVGAALEQPPITSWQNGDPRLRFLTFDGVHVARARSLEIEGKVQSLVRSPTATLVADVSRPGRAGTLIGFDVGDSDWPLKASFVLFARNLIEQARAHRNQSGGTSAQTGLPLRVPVPAQVSEAEVRAPGREAPEKVPARDGLAVVPSTPRAGIYHVTYGGPEAGSALVPVNLTSEKESDLRPKKALLEQQGVHVESAAKLADAHTDWSWLVAALALALIVADTLWLTRKPARRPALTAAPPRPERAS